MFLPSCTQPMHSTMYDFTSIFWCQMHTAIFSYKKEQQFFLCHTTGRPYLIDVTHLGGRVSAKRWLYSISLFSKMGDKGEEGAKMSIFYKSIFSNDNKFARIVHSAEDRPPNIIWEGALLKWMLNLKWHFYQLKIKEMNARSA